MTGIVIVGVGPGIGASIARRFAREGFRIGLVARREDTLNPILDELSEIGAEAVGEAADAGDETQLTRALERIGEVQGVPDVLVYNAAVVRPDEPGELTWKELLETVEINVLGGLHAGALTGAMMGQRGNGSILFTGGMPAPVPQMTSLSLGKAGLRAVADLLGKQLGPAGVHVATVTVSGGPVMPGGRWDPDQIAETFWDLHKQPRNDWQLEVVH